MKVNEKAHYDEATGKLIVESTYDNNPALHQARMYRDAGVGQSGEHRLIGTLPMHLVKEWLKEAGVSWDDPAASDVIKRKILSGEFDKFRVWEGTY